MTDNPDEYWRDYLTAKSAEWHSRSLEAKTLEKAAEWRSMAKAARLLASEIAPRDGDWWQRHFSAAIAAERESCAAQLDATAKELAKLVPQQKTPEAYILFTSRLFQLQESAADIRARNP